MKKAEKGTALWAYFFWPFLFTLICWIVWIYDYQVGIHPKWGVIPRTYEGLKGIVFSPFLHQNFNHLVNNSFPLLLLGSSLFFFYSKLPFRVFFWLYLGGGSWLWCLGRDGNHIGASGLVYGLFSFILVGGLISKNKSLIAMSFLAIFIYGGMIWGVFPIEDSISWEGHLTSLVWGVILAVVYRKHLPQPVEIKLSEDDSINEQKFGADYWKTEHQISTQEHQEPTFIQYHYIQKNKEKKSES